MTSYSINQSDCNLRRNVHLNRATPELRYNLPQWATPGIGALAQHPPHEWNRVIRVHVVTWRNEERTSATNYYTNFRSKWTFDKTHQNYDSATTPEGLSVIDMQLQCDSRV